MFSSSSEEIQSCGLCKFFPVPANHGVIMSVMDVVEEGKYLERTSRTFLAFQALTSENFL